MPEQQRFDPRFNPAFQRGFDVSAEQARRASATPSLTPEDVMYGRSARPDFTAPPPPPPSADGTPAAAMDVRVAVLPQEPRDDRHNPFVWALWVLGVVLIGGSIGVMAGPMRILFSGNNSVASDPGALALAQFLYVACPALITVGLATVSGLLFWHAAAWKARRR
ncbi:hypothetical protein GCM10027052_20200 [Parafrigoribacterium mesophilum]|uniref:hypothetical protein n=1 Tax=Parafrigoribacterium mesophilum TaxID=433646 RepID=UPI0031FD1CEB